jgi:phosphoribosyl 1,2-cyclic phosphodiesterase
MKLIVLGSSSLGNGYILKSRTGQCLVLEAGVNISVLKKALNYDISGVVGCLVTHRHGDHIKFSKSYIEAGIDIYTGGENGLGGHRFKEIRNLEQLQIGEFLVKPFDVEHDVPTFGFIIQHEESGNICFITDTAYCKYRLPNMNNIIIEANYSREILNDRWAKGELNTFVMDRIIGSHMAFETTLEFLTANDLSAVNKIVLIHLSNSNSDRDYIKTEAIVKTGKTVEIAEKGLVVELDKTPF